MKVLTLHQPWASLVALGVKTIETRSWSTQYRGPLAIHAAKSVEHEGWQVGDWRWYRGHDGASIIARKWSGQAAGKGVEAHALHLGAIVATCTLVDVVPIVGWAADPQANHVTVCLDGALHSYKFVPDVLPLTWKKRDPFEVTDQRPYGDFTPGRFAWLLADVVPVVPPVPFKGGQGLTKTWTP